MLKHPPTRPPPGRRPKGRWASHWPWQSSNWFTIRSISQVDVWHKRLVWTFLLFLSHPHCWCGRCSHSGQIALMRSLGEGDCSFIADCQNCMFYWLLLGRGKVQNDEGFSHVNRFENMCFQGQSDTGTRGRWHHRSETFLPSTHPGDLVTSELSWLRGSLGEALIQSGKIWGKHRKHDGKRRVCSTYSISATPFWEHLTESLSSHVINCVFVGVVWVGDWRLMQLWSIKNCQLYTNCIILHPDTIYRTGMNQYQRHNRLINPASISHTVYVWWCSLLTDVVTCVWIYMYCNCLMTRYTWSMSNVTYFCQNLKLFPFISLTVILRWYCGDILNHLELHG